MLNQAFEILSTKGFSEMFYYLATVPCHVNETQVNMLIGIVLLAFVKYRKDKKVKIN